MSKSISIEIIKENLPKHVIVDEKTYKGTQTKARFIDSEFGEWWALPYTVIRGTGHPKRGIIKCQSAKKNWEKIIKKREQTCLKKYGVISNLQTKEVQKKIKKWNNKQRITIKTVKKHLPKYLSLDESTFKGAREKARFIDSEYGEWWTRPYRIVQKRNHPKRAVMLNARNKILPIKELQKRLPNGIKIVKSSYISSGKPAIFIDPKYGKFRSRFHTVLKGKQHPKRYAEKILAARIKSGASKTISNGTPVSTIIKNSGVDRTTALMIFKKYGEGALFSFIERGGNKKTDVEISFIQLMKNDFFLKKHNKRPTETKKITYKPDFRLIKKDGEVLYINVDGLYWHSEKFAEKKYHYKMRKEFEKYGLRILQFYYDEILDKGQIVRSIVLNILGLTKNTTEIKKCILKEIDKNIAKNFLNKNHLMGNGNKTLSFGLFYKDKIISCMSILIFNNKKEVYISRFANIINYNIPESFPKILSYIIQKYPNYKIVSHCDMRYSTGASFESHGFKQEKETIKSYWTNGRRRFNRQFYRAKNGKTRKLLKIWDAGKRRYAKHQRFHPSTPS